MTRTTLTLAALTGLAALAPAASAETPLTAAQLTPLLTGNTLYVTIPPGAPGAAEGGIAPIYYGADGSAAALLPDGPKLIGTWAMTGDGYCVDWDNGPQNSCSSLMRAEDSFVILDQSSGDPRGQVFTVRTGNPEAL